MKKEMKQKIIFWTVVGVSATLMVVATIWSLCNLDRW